jgi:hypothetical protein
MAGLVAHNAVRTKKCAWTERQLTELTTGPALTAAAIPTRKANLMFGVGRKLILMVS